MKNSSEISNFIDQYLITVQKPGRYVGGEFNATIKEWGSVPIHVALAFPDIYDIGFSNLGIAALYDAVNSRDDALAERVFSPWMDMEDLLRKHRIPLFSLENKKPLADFDIIGITIPYETLYTNVLNLLDLGGISIKSSDRAESDPIIMAGGHTTFNPEPMSKFIDAFVIGEGEEVIHEILDVYASLKKDSSDRNAALRELGKIQGVYVPKHFSIVLEETHTVESIVNKIIPNKQVVKKRIIEKIQKPIPQPIVPNIQVVHDRLSFEIMRGCGRGCRFCQAGFINRPVREVGKKEILMAIRNSVKSTGITEISLLSLSVSDHSQIIDIITDLDDISNDLSLNFSLPSLRIESFDQDVIGAIKGKKKGNFTLAPEAGSDALRASINKPIPHESIFETVKGICKQGWNNIKLYFMIGFPGETVEDVIAIRNLCLEINKYGRQINKGRFKLHVSVNILIPKTHTPYQWAAFESRESANQKFELIINDLRKQKIKVDYPDYDAASLEAVLSRGGREISDVIFNAWRKGARFDAWREGFSPEIWDDAFINANINPMDLISKEKPLEKSLPWDHIDSGVNKSFLKSEYTHSIEGHVTPGCFEHCQACGIQSSFLLSCKKIRVGANAS